MTKLVMPKRGNKRKQREVMPALRWLAKGNIEILQVYINGKWINIPVVRSPDN